MQALPVTAPAPSLPPKREEAPDPQDARFGAVMASLLPFQAAPPPEPPPRPETPAPTPEVRETGAAKVEESAPARRPEAPAAPKPDAAAPKAEATAPEAPAARPEVAAPTTPALPPPAQAGLPLPGPTAVPAGVAPTPIPGPGSSTPTPLPPATEAALILPKDVRGLKEAAVAPQVQAPVSPATATASAPPAPEGPVASPLPTPPVPAPPEHALRAERPTGGPAESVAPALDTLPPPTLGATGARPLPQDPKTEALPAGSAPAGEPKPLTGSKAPAPEAAPPATPASTAPRVEGARPEAPRAEGPKPEAPRIESARPAPTPLLREPLSPPTPAAPVAEVAAAPRTTPSPVVTQVEGTLRWMVKGPVPEARLQLHPESLGKVSIELKVEQGQVHAKVLVQEPAALQALQDGRASLEAALKQSGLQLGSFDLQQGGDASRHAPEPRQLPLPPGRGEDPSLRNARQEAPPGALPRGANPRRIELYA